jgi:hypothetical protein
MKFILLFGGSLDASNMFKPALARGEIQIIGATTLDEYRKHIEKDALNVDFKSCSRTYKCRRNFTNS